MKQICKLSKNQTIITIISSGGETEWLVEDLTAAGFVNEPNLEVSQNRVFQQALLIPEDGIDKTLLPIIVQIADEGGEVFIIPKGESLIKDPFGLIKSGAKVAYSAKDILDELRIPAIESGNLLQ